MGGGRAALLLRRLLYYGGSFGKKTLIAAHFDLDLVIYFPAGDPKELYAAVERRLRAAGHAPSRHNVALRLAYTRGLHVDVVPGRALDETYSYADLYANERDTTRRTSLKAHTRKWRIGNSLSCTPRRRCMTSRALAFD
jgi:hypothetical protein